MSEASDRDQPTDAPAKRWPRRRVLATGATAAAGLFIGDQLIGQLRAWNLPPVETHLLLRPGSRTLVHVFGGIATSARAVSLLPGEQIAARSSSVAAHGRYTGIRHQATIEHALQIQRDIDPEKTVVIGQSMGAVPAAELSRRIHESGGRVNLLIGDSACSSANAVKLGSISVVRGVDADVLANPVTRSWLLSTLKPGYVRDNLMPPLDQRQADIISEETFRAYQAEIINAPFAVIGDQLDFIAEGFRFEPGELQGVADRVVHIHSTMPQQDAFVKPDVSQIEMQGWFGAQPVDRIYDQTRLTHNHTATAFTKSLTDMVAEVEYDQI